MPPKSKSNCREGRDQMLYTAFDRPGTLRSFSMARPSLGFPARWRASRPRSESFYCLRLWSRKASRCCFLSLS